MAGKTHFFYFCEHFFLIRHYNFISLAFSTTFSCSVHIISSCYLNNQTEYYTSLIPKGNRSTNFMSMSTNYTLELNLIRNKSLQFNP